MNIFKKNKTMKKKLSSILFIGTIIILSGCNQQQQVYTEQINYDTQIENKSQNNNLSINESVKSNQEIEKKINSTHK
jgi:hypothetical protein